MKRIASAFLTKSQRLYFRVFKRKKLPMVKLFDQFTGLNFVVLKADVPYMPKNFPASYPIGKDLDILVAKENFSQAISAIEEFIRTSEWMYDAKIRRSNTRVKVRFLWFGLLHYQIDCAFDLELRGFESGLLKSKVRYGSFFVPDLSHELLYRFFEYRDNPGKIHHLEYIKKHMDSWDVSLAHRYGVALPGELGNE